MENSRFKFRVWDKSEESYFTQEDFTIYLEPDGRLQIIGTGVDGEDCFFETKDIVLEQCTDLMDKNGKLIYEGDIVKDIEGYIGQVKFCDGTARFIIEFAEDISDFSRDMPHELKIIGNIHENADLLGEE